MNVVLMVDLSIVNVSSNVHNKLRNNTIKSTNKITVCQTIILIDICKL